MKLWDKIKSLGWIATAGIVLTAILMALGGAKAGRLQRRVTETENQLTTLAHDRTKKGIEKAAKLQKTVEKHKEKAAVTRQRTEARLKELGEKDETLADIADRFNKRKLRNGTS
jgi:hypothetical protein